MKINKITKFKHKLLNIKLIKTKIHKTFKLDNFLKIKSIRLRLKKALHIIYKYHVSNKQILFLGTPLIFNKKIKYLLKNTRHIFVPEFLWKNGVISNVSSNNTLKLLFKLKKIPDLIVSLNKSFTKTVLKESHKTKIITVLFSDNASYKIPGNFEFVQKQTRNNFFYSILVAILKKPLYSKNNVSNNSFVTKQKINKKFLYIFKKHKH